MRSASTATNGAAAPGARPTALIPQFDNIPAELCERVQWVVWRYKQEGEKWTKVPFCARGGAGSVSDPRTWGTFDEAVAAYRKGGYDGIGYVFSEDDPYAGADFDHCVEGSDGDRRVNESAVEWLRKFDSYTRSEERRVGKESSARGRS